MSPSRSSYLLEAERLTKKPNFTREDSARCESLMRLAELTSPSISEARLRTLRLQEEMNGGITREMLNDFFAGRSVRHPAFSEDRGQLVFRTYSALDSTVTGSGEELVPIGFQADVIQAMRAYDGLFDAATWLFTRTGNVLHYPLSDDTDATGDAAVITQNAANSQGPNPIFGDLSFPSASNWATAQLLYSAQLDADSGVDLSSYFSRIFGLRLARGPGKNFLTTLTTGATTGVTTASPTAIVETEVFDMFDAIDVAYQARAGWLMSASTYIAISKIRTSGGAVSFPMQRDEAGRPLLLNRPVYLCPNMDSIAATKKVAAFGALDRFVVRSAMNSFQVFVYREKYMPNHQLATQAFQRMDGKLGLASVSDAPVKLLVMHS